VNAPTDRVEALAAAWGHRLAALDARIGSALGRPASDTELAPASVDVAGVRWTRQGDAVAAICRELGLDDIDEAILVLALAPEVDLRVGAALALLAGDAQCRRPSVGTAMALAASPDQSPLALRRRLRPGSPRVETGAIRLEDADGAGSEFQALLVPAPAVVSVATGDRAADAALAPALQSVAATAMAACRPLPALARYFRRARAGGGIAVVQSEAPLDPVAVAAAAADAGLGLVQVDLAGLTMCGLAPRAAALRAVLVARLDRRAVLVAAPPAENAAARVMGRALLSAAAAAGLPVALDGASGAALLAPGDPWPVTTVETPPADAAERARLWSAALAAGGVNAARADVVHLGARFRLADAAIRAVASDVAPSADGEPVPRADLVAAARRRSSRALDRLAQRVPLRLRLDDLVLPAGTRRRIDDILAAIRAREVVYGDWGLLGKGHAGAGLCVLFSGVSGVGKTATAAALAAELEGQVLYRIDLAAVVSKYIGETEKNLDRIFDAARDSDGLLLFDEADALFGKRAEVKDAHDRYANLETAYLLQRMEAHDGVSILATNLSRNLDAAFSRRIHYAVEFPRPDAALREALWRQMLPCQAPQDDGIDVAYLAARFELTGGDIRAATLDAAFLAAAGRGRIGLPELVQAVARLLARQGRPMQVRDFRPYDHLLAGP
jgi:hypothetical protein